MLPLKLTFIMLLALSSLTMANQINFAWMDNPAESATLVIHQSEYGDCIELTELAKALGMSYKISSHKERLRIDLPAARLIFTKGLPYVLADGKLMQMPLSLESSGDGFWLAIDPALEIIGNYYAGSLYFDPSGERILAAKPSGDILGVRFDVGANGGQAVLTTISPLKCNADPERDGSVCLTIPKASADTARLNAISARGAIASMTVEQNWKEVRITLIPAEGARFDHLDSFEDPPAQVAVFTYDEARQVSPDVNAKLSQERDRWSMDVVVIDAGHGGKDPGAVGKGRTYEKTITLDVAKRLEKALNKKGIKTVMVRDSDKFLALHERTKLANQAGGKLFISLHCNACTDKRAHGLETYFLSPTKSDRARAVAAKENEVIQYEENQADYSQLTEENFILLSMAQTGFIRESQEFAGVIQEQVSAKTGLKNRGVDQAGFYVLVGASMPAVLFEMGFISNPKELKLLRGKSFRQKLADGICDAVVEFLE